MSYDKGKREGDRNERDKEGKRRGNDRIVGRRDRGTNIGMRFTSPIMECALSGCWKDHITISL